MGEPEMLDENSESMPDVSLSGGGEPPGSEIGPYKLLNVLGRRGWGLKSDMWGLP